MRIQHRISIAVRRLWNTDRPLTAVGLLMIAATAATLIGLVVDSRTITGVPAWLKPMKFAVSTAIYSLTLAWMFQYLVDWPRVRRFVGRSTAFVFVLEVAIIAIQAWRGTTSHFNVRTPLDAAIFAVMGSAIAIQTLLSILVAVALWRQRFANHTLAWALRVGMTLTILGAATGGLMTRPTAAQIAEARVTHRMLIAGAHTVGAPDGGPGLPVTGWSRNHGDLRAPHFVGLHAIQSLALVALLLGRLRVADRRRTQLMLVAAGAYATLFVALLWQALQGRPLVPQVTTAAVTVWAAATIVATSFMVGYARRSASPRTDWRAA
jgi:hypothetical protein